jgi:hypothetical protein
VTANGWGSDAAGDTSAGNDSPQAGSSSHLDDPARGEAGYAGQPESVSQAESEPGPLPGGLPGGLTPGLLVPGMGVQSPALDYVLGKQRRRARHVATVAASVLAVVVVVAVVGIAAHSGAKKAGSVQLTAAKIVQQATRQEEALHSLSATFSADLSGQVAGTITGTLQMQRNPLLMSMNMNLAATGQAMTLRAILSGNAMYLKLNSAARVPSSLSGKWAKIPLTGLGSSSLFGSLQHEIQNENPVSQLAGLSAAEHLHAAGTQVVSGVTTTRYNGSFTPSAAVKALGAAQRSALGPSLKQIKGDVALSVWIDSSDYVRKFQATESIDDVTINFSYTFGSFNEPVKITLPPPSQTYSPSASALND